MSLGTKLLTKLCQTQDIQTAVKLGSMVSTYAVGDEEKTLVEKVNAHLQDYGVLPSDETLMVYMDGNMLPTVEEPVEFYISHMRQRYVDKGIRSGVQRIEQYLKGSDKEPEKALSLLTETIGELNLAVQADSIHDYRNAATTLYPAYIAQMTGAMLGVELGWPYVDEQMGGAQAGDLISTVGRPGEGKTFLLLYAAYHLWKTQKKIPLFITMEMKPWLIEQRLAAIDAKIPAMDIKLANLTSIKQGKYKQHLQDLQGCEIPFYIIDGGFSATVKDIIALVRQLRPHCVYVDGAYLMKSEDPRSTRFQRVNDVAEGLKHGLASNCDIPVLASWQFSRQATKKKDKGEPIGLEDIAYADAIGQLSSLVFGLFQPHSPESVITKEILLMKGRSGETGKFHINWDFTDMDFTELTQAQLNQEVESTVYHVEDVG